MTHRFVVDYRQLNKITKPIAHPLPLLESVFDAIGSAQAQYFTTLDLASGYWQIPMDPASKFKAAFITHDGIYEFNRMPFGLRNAPMSFQMIMSQILRSLNWKRVLCYIDDILILSKTFDDHLCHLRQMFQRLRDAKLTLKPSKCHFAVAKVTYLGHTISKAGIEVDPSNTDAVRTFPVPKILKLINLKYPEFYVAHTPVDQLYKSDNFLYARQNNSLFITIKLPISAHKSNLRLFDVMAFPVPIKSTSADVKQLLDLPDHFAISADQQFYATLTDTELTNAQEKSIYIASLIRP